MTNVNGVPSDIKEIVPLEGLEIIPSTDGLLWGDRPVLVDFSGVYSRHQLEIRQRLLAVRKLILG